MKLDTVGSVRQFYIRIKSLIIFCKIICYLLKNAAKQSVQRSRENIEKFNPNITQLFFKSIITYNISKDSRVTRPYFQNSVFYILYPLLKHWGWAGPSSNLHDP